MLSNSDMADIIAIKESYWKYGGLVRRVKSSDISKFPDSLLGEFAENVTKLEILGDGKFVGNWNRFFKHFKYVRQLHLWNIEIISLSSLPRRLQRLVLLDSRLTATRQNDWFEQVPSTLNEIEFVCTRQAAPGTHAPACLHLTDIASAKLWRTFLSSSALAEFLGNNRHTIEYLQMIYATSTFCDLCYMNLNCLSSISKLAISNDILVGQLWKSLCRRITHLRLFNFPARFFEPHNVLARFSRLYFLTTCQMDLYCINQLILALPNLKSIRITSFFSPSKLEEFFKVIDWLEERLWKSDRQLTLKLPATYQVNPVFDNNLWQVK